MTGAGKVQVQRLPSVSTLLSVWRARCTARSQAFCVSLDFLGFGPISPNLIQYMHKHDSTCVPNQISLILYIKLKKKKEKVNSDVSSAFNWAEPLMNGEGVKGPLLAPGCLLSPGCLLAPGCLLSPGCLRSFEILWRASHCSISDVSEKTQTLDRGVTLLRGSLWKVDQERNVYLTSCSLLELLESVRWFNF